MQQNLAPIFLLADTLGLRVEYFIDGTWVGHRHWMPDHKTQVRVHPEDMGAYEKLLAMIPEFYETIDYHGYKYLLPKNTQVGDVVIFYFGMGAYSQKQEDGSFLDLDFKDSHQKYKNISLHTSCSESVFYHIKD